jgi:hypothetical protein
MSQFETLETALEPIENQEETMVDAVVDGSDEPNEEASEEEETEETEEGEEQEEV